MTDLFRRWRQGQQLRKVNERMYARREAAALHAMGMARVCGDDHPLTARSEETVARLRHLHQELVTFTLGGDQA